MLASLLSPANPASPASLASPSGPPDRPSFCAPVGSGGRASMPGLPPSSPDVANAAPVPLLLHSTPQRFLARYTKLASQNETTEKLTGSQIDEPRFTINFE